MYWILDNILAVLVVFCVVFTFCFFSVKGIKHLAKEPSRMSPSGCVLEWEKTGNIEDIWDSRQFEDCKTLEINFIQQ